MFLMKYSFPVFLFFAANTSFADNSVASMLSDYIYLFELVVIAIVALALIMLTLSIAKSRRRISDMVKEIRGEMNEERTVFAMTVKSIKEKEKQVSYMAHLLQTHLENSGGEANTGKKKAISDEMVVEILDDVIHENEQHSKNSSDTLSTSDTQKNKPVSTSSVARFSTSQQASVSNQNPVDPRTIAADGSIKRAHFGPDQYLADISNFQRQAYQRVQSTVKQADQYLANMVNDITSEMDFVKAERANLKDFIFAINSNIRKNDPQKMNPKDRKIVKRLSSIDGRLQALEASHLEINACYAETIFVLNKYSGSLSNEAIEETVTTPA